MRSNVPPSPLIWLDLEFSDLEVDKGVIVEIATIITDGNLKVIDIGPDIVIHQSEEILNNMAQWNKEHFGESGLLEEIRQSTTSLAQAEDDTLNFLKKHCAPKTALLAGSSIYMDRGYLKRFMPKIHQFVHYRMIDVSTIKELMYRWYPSLPDYPKVEPHRAKGDILESIDELKYYQAKIFK